MKQEASGQKFACEDGDAQMYLNERKIFVEIHLTVDDGCALCLREGRHVHLSVEEVLHDLLQQRQHHR